MCGILKIKPKKLIGLWDARSRTRVTNGFIHWSKSSNAIHFNDFIVRNFTTFCQKSFSFSLRRKFEEKLKIFKIFTHPIKNTINPGKLAKKKAKSRSNQQGCKIALVEEEINCTRQGKLSGSTTSFQSCTVMLQETTSRNCRQRCCMFLYTIKNLETRFGNKKSR